VDIELQRIKKTIFEEYGLYILIVERDYIKETLE
jgi:hypothetical protein